MSSKYLAVVLYGQHVADIEQTRGGAHRLHYTGTPGLTPVSLSMPIVGETHGHRTVEPFLLGLLPDKEDIKQTMGREFGVAWRNPFALLGHIGLDCAGAVQFVEPSDLDEVLARKGALRPVSGSAIGARLRELRSDPAASWVAPSERWSLAGTQAKVALRQMPDGSWADPSGSEPTTHIIKPGIDRLNLQALNEHVCLDTAARLRLPAARTEYVEFDGEPAIVVRRYDRREMDGRIERIHQEDVCQALAVRPENKYESEGGPRAKDVVELLQTNISAARDRRSNAHRFVQYLAFNYLVGAPDAHAKNYSVLLLGDEVRLAPLYDVASGLPYDATDEFSGLRNAAMAIGGNRRFGYVTGKHWVQFARESRLDPEQVLATVERLAERIPDAMSDAMGDEAVRAHTGPLRKRMLDNVAELCAVSRASLRSSRRDAVSQD